MATSGDNPIRSKTEDSLGRDRVARSIVRAVREADASEGYVIGIVGPWGSGKTSLLNLVREELAAAPPLTVVEFNPWMFSGAEQLVEAFFNELGAQLRTESKELVGLADDLQRYGEALAPLRFLPIVGPWIERIRGGAGAIKQLLDARRGGVAGLRERVAKKLASLSQPIVVVLDDIDRLHVDEIRDVFKLVRLTASFPNLIYLVAFDRTRVEAALQEHGLEGRAYLEKILQVSFDIPVLPQGVLVSQLTRAVDAAIDDVPEPGPFDPDTWQDILAEIIFPLVRQMRDVRRYAAAVRATVLDLAGSIALVDVLALEAVRVFLPDTFSLLGGSVAGLTTTSQIGYGGHEPPQLKHQIERLLASSDSHPEVVRAMIRRLFPAGIRHFENNHFGPDWLKTWAQKPVESRTPTYSTCTSNGSRARVYLRSRLLNELSRCWAMRRRSTSFSQRLIPQPSRMSSRRSKHTRMTFLPRLSPQARKFSSTGLDAYPSVPAACSALRLDSRSPGSCSGCFADLRHRRRSRRRRRRFCRSFSP